MKIFYLFLGLNIMIVNYNCGLAQDTRVWEIEKHQQAEEKKRQLDSIAMQNREYLPGATINLKSQFPIQHAIGLEFSTPIFLSAYVGIGQLSRAYIVTASAFLSAENENEAARKQFIRDKLQNGFVFELGAHYHILKWRDVYAGFNLQFQRFRLPATPQELFENYDFGDTQGFSPEVEDLLESNSLLRDFYENTLLTPTISPIQLGLTVGKRFHFKKVNRLFLDLELSYQFNISNRVKIDADSFIGQILVSNFIGPVLEEGTNNSFDSFNLPSLSLRLSYRLGDKIHHNTIKK